MHHAVFDEFGPPSDVVRVDEAEPRAPDSTEIRVRVAASPINPSDLLYIEGKYGIKPDLPASPGFEAVGIVETAGAESPLQAGQRVALLTFGAWRELVTMPALMAHPVPDDLDDTTACSLFVNPLSALAMVDELSLPQGAWLLLTAGASALGRIAQAAAQARGIKVVSTVRRDDQAELLRANGCDAVINTRKESMSDVAAQVTGGNGVDGVLDAVGGRVGAEAIACLAPGGTALLYGLLSMRPTMISNGDMLFRRLTLKGFWLTNWLKTTDPERIRALLDEAIAGFERGDFMQRVDSQYALADVCDALARAAESGRDGKVILTFGA
jgi:NADPH:quinone reductase-like Zn-dependent oxidoreductase